MKSKRRILVLSFALILILAFTISSFSASQGVDHRRKIIKIGWYGPLTGILQKIGESMVFGMKGYIELRNKRGGVGGYKVVLKAYDNNMDPILTKQVLKKLVKEDRVFALVGALGSKGINAVFSDMVAYGIPVVYLGGGEYHWAVPPRRNVFPIQPDYITEGRLLIKFAVQNLNGRRIGFIYRIADNIGRTALRGAKIGMKQYGRRVGAKFALIMKRLAVNVVAAKLKKVKPDVTIIFDVFGGATGIVSAAKRSGVNTKWVTSYVNSDNMLYKITGKAWLGTYIGGWAKTAGRKIREFQRFFKTTRYHRIQLNRRWDSPSNYNVAGWIACEIFYGGLDKFYRKYRNMRKLTWDNYIRTMETFRKFNNTMAKDITYYPMSMAKRGTKYYYLARRGQLTLFFFVATLNRNKKFFLKRITGWLR